MAKEENIILDKSFEFSVDIVLLCRKLKKEKEFELSSQLIRSGTSIGANVEEAQAGQSRKDFISKMTIALKEARETRYWLCILDTCGVRDIDFSPYLQKSEALVNILSAIVKTSKG